jgi:hypothetical protein
VGNVVRAFFEAFQGFLGGNPVLAVPAEIGGGVGKVSHKRKGRWFLIQCGAFSPRRPEGNTEPTSLQALFASFFRKSSAYFAIPKAGFAH